MRLTQIITPIDRMVAYDNPQEINLKNMKEMQIASNWHEFTLLLLFVLQFSLFL
jgi:hypothetical protein